MVGSDGKVVPAAQFVPAIEQLGLMRSIDNRVRDLAIRELERDGGASLAINISGLTATERSWFRGLVARLTERRDIATSLIVGLTEPAALQDHAEKSRLSP